MSFGDVHRSRWSLEGLVVLLVVALLAACASGDGGGAGDADASAPVADEATAADGSEFLLVADPAQQRLYVYTIPDHEVVAELDRIAMSTHPGYLALPDGRVLLSEEDEGLIMLQVSDDGAEIAARVPAGPGVHLAADADGQYAAASTGRWDDETGGMRDPAITLVDLDTYESTQFPIDTGEPGIAVAGDPLRVLHRNDEPPQVEVFPVESILADEHAFVEDLPIGPTGHGEAISHARNHFYIATDEGMEVVDVGGGTMDHMAVVPWEVSGRSSGRAYYVRTTPDANFLVTYVANRAPPYGTMGPEWGTWENDAYILDLETHEATRAPIANGWVFRLGVGEGHAIFVNLTPVGDPDGDHAHILDLDPDSDTFGTVVARIPLPELTQRGAPEPPLAEQPDAERRHVTMTPDGRYGYVSNGGDGTISVIDTQTHDIVDTIETPSPLRGGGYLTTVQVGASFVDTIAR